MGTMQSPADPFFWLHHGMVDRNWQLWRNLSPANAASYCGLLTDSLTPWGYQVNDVINNLGVMVATTTQYPGKNQLPIGDHCSVCYRPIFCKWWWWDSTEIMHTVNFRDKDLDTILVEKFSPEELKKRRSDDYWVLKILEANPGYTQDDLIEVARNGCNKFNLPKEVTDSIENLNLSVDAVKLEFCDIILTPIFEGNPVTLIAPFDDVEDKNPVCGEVSRNSSKFELLVTQEALKERLYGCPNSMTY